MLKGKKYKVFKTEMEFWTFMDKLGRISLKPVRGGLCMYSKRLEHYAEGLHRRFQICIRKYTSMTPRAQRLYRYINHYVLDSDCIMGAECLCLRAVADKNYGLTKKVLIATHKVGECPHCKYEEGKSYEDYEVNSVGN